MKTFIKQKFISVYDQRSLVYTLLISASLFFLLSISEYVKNIYIFHIIAFGLFAFLVVEFLFSTFYSDKKYVPVHPLYSLMKKMRKEHLQSFILFPVAQYFSCVLIIYFNSNMFINTMAVILSSVVAYFVFFVYLHVYKNDLNKLPYHNELFEMAKYLSLALITYLTILFLFINTYSRFWTAVVIGMVQIIYFLASLSRRDKLNIITGIMSLILSIIIIAFSYFIFRQFPVDSVSRVLFATAQIILLDYILTGLFLAWVEDKLNWSIFFEYILITLINILLIAVAI